MKKEKRRAAAANPTLSTPPSDSTECSDRTDELALDRLLVGDTDLWVRLFDGEFRLAVRCKVCGRWLTAGASKRAGVGPNCAARAVHR